MFLPADTAFVGQLGANELAAFSINSSVFTFAFLVFNFLSTATTPAVAAALATDDKEKVRMADNLYLLHSTALANQGLVLTCSHGVKVQLAGSSD